MLVRVWIELSPWQNLPLNYISKLFSVRSWGCLSFFLKFLYITVPAHCGPTSGGGWSWVWLGAEKQLMEKQIVVTPTQLGQMCCWKTGRCDTRCGHMWFAFEFTCSSDVIFFFFLLNQDEKQKVSYVSLSCCFSLLTVLLTGCTNAINVHVGNVTPH